MTYADIDLTEMPANFTFHKLVDAEFVRWEVYEPTTVESDIPFNDGWWKFLYWMPKIRKEFYELTIKSTNFEYDLVMLATDKYGMDWIFFQKYYKDFIKRLHWMRRNNSENHIGEVIL